MCWWKTIATASRGLDKPPVSVERPRHHNRDVRLIVLSANSSSESPPHRQGPTQPPNALWNPRCTQLEIRLKREVERCRNIATQTYLPHDVTYSAIATTQTVDFPAFRNK
ncbi:unnamed protein product [Phytomonas sp. Hart1]|nr:unnamed protein product [Phytomonas sp. Hart1]|eukprot:CCW69863.1 unnamed protein product [Phytomonas sp. isolate Hart1]